MNTSRTAETVLCERCGKKIDEDNLIWLELSFKTGRYSPEGATGLPATESQGYFPFGADCAAAVINAGGYLRRIGRAARR